MAGQSGKILLALIIFVTTGIASTEELESTLLPCASDNSPCDYQHHIRCSQDARISVTGARQKFSFDVAHCFAQGFTCSHDCCRRCTLTASRDALLSLKQHCDSKENCTASVPRKHVICGVFEKVNFYSHGSTVTFDCITASSLVSVPDKSSTEFSTSQKAITTRASDVTTEQFKSSATTTPVRAASLSTAEYKARQDGSSDKGDNSNMTVAASVAGSVGGAIILAVVCLVAWCSRRRQRRTPSAKMSDASILPDTALESPSRQEVQAHTKSTASPLSRVQHQNHASGMKDHDLSPGRSSQHSDVHNAYEQLDQASKSDVTAAAPYEELNCASNSRRKERGEESDVRRGCHGSDVNNAYEHLDQATLDASIASSYEELHAPASAAVKKDGAVASVSQSSSSGDTGSSYEIVDPMYVNKSFVK